MGQRKQPPVRGQQLVSDLYGSLLECKTFEQPLRVLARAFRSHLSGLHSEDFRAGEGSVTILGSLSRAEYEAYALAYSNRWSKQNLWMERSLDGLLGQGYQHGEAVVGNDELVASPYYQHFLRHLDVHYSLGISIGSRAASQMAVASFNRARADGGFDERDLALVRWIRPHLVNAYALYSRIATADERAGTLQKAVDLAPLGMLWLDAGGVLRRCNPAAESMLASLGLIGRGRDGRLALAAPVGPKVAAAVRRCIGGPWPVPVTLRLDRGQPDGNALVLHLYGCPESPASGAPPAVVGFLNRLSDGQRSDIDQQVVQAVLGLTPAEARVALALHACNDVEVAAPHLGLAPATVRAHVKRVYQKLGISRQGELTVLVERCLVGRS
jgi:DNA-binding CsgD family transcriptional regulator